jgi:hypothetical protein
VGKQPPDCLTALGWTTALALLGNVLVYVSQFLFLWLVLGIRIVPVLVFGLLALIGSLLVFTHLRWAPLLGALVAGVTTVVLLVVPDTISALLHPAVDPGHFGSTLFTLAFALMTIVAGAATTVQTSRSRQTHTPGWLVAFLSGVGCFAVGAILVAIIASGNLVNASPGAMTNGVPTVHTAGGTFLTPVVLVPKGQKLLLVDDDATEHIIQNGAWTSSGMPESQIEPGAPIVRALDLTKGSTEIGPFSIAGVYHLYCSIHKGMNLTIVVQ